MRSVLLVNSADLHWVACAAFVLPLKCTSQTDYWSPRSTAGCCVQAWADHIVGFVALCDVLPVTVGLQARKCCRNRCRCKVFRLGDHPHPRDLTRAPELPSRRQLRRAPAYAILYCTPAETCMPYLRGLRLKRPSVFVFLHPSSTNANSLQSFPRQQLLISFRHINANTGAQHPCTAIRADPRAVASPCCTICPGHRRPWTRRCFLPS